MQVLDPAAQPATDAIRVVLADVNVVLRRAMARVLGKAPDIHVLASVESTDAAVEAVRQHRPDVLVLDLHGEGLDGLAVLRRLRTERLACSVILFSAQNPEEAASTIHGMELGASDFVAKPMSGSFSLSLSIIEHELLPRLRALGHHARLLSGRPSHPAEVKSRGSVPSRIPPPASTPPTPAPRPFSPPRLSAFPTGVVAIGASTGGPEALMRLLPGLPADFPVPLLIVQHMPPVFTATLAQRLDQVSPLHVVEALDGEPLLGGTAYLAPGGRHMTVTREGSLLRVRLNDDPPVNSCRPSVDVLFDSVARVFGSAVVGVILTGMGADGTSGARSLKQGGARILTQSAETCLVFGMPKVVQDAGLSDEQLPITSLAARLRELHQ